ncbi:TolC family protein [Rubritalea marina]|uniref:TolC family protein n=1 Tax=Rubritalea marina TaxID=361055 RepID=UPI00037F7203|nr:TolC family protein [Rubritalea marina]
MKALLLALWAAVLTTACSSNSTNGSKSAPVVEVDSSRTIPAEPKAYSIPRQAGPETLAAMAIRHNPRLQALRHRAQRLNEKVPQALALPDPNASLALGKLPETAAGQVDAVVGVSQKIPYPGKRKSAALAARSEALAIQADANAYALKLSEQVRSAWWDYYLATVTIRISQESRELLQVAEETVEAQVAASQSGQADQLRVANEITKVDRDLAQARRLMQTAQARLNSLLNRPVGSALPAPSNRSVKTPSNLENLLARAEANHPEVISASNKIAAFKHRLQRAKLEKYPDFTFGLQGAAVASNGIAPSANGRDQIFGTLGFNIPLWQEPRRAMIREANAGIAETQALLGSTRADLRYRVEDAYFRAKTAREVSELFKGRLIPDAKQAYEVTLSSYAAGEDTFTNVIDTWRQWLTYQLQFAQNRAQLGKAVSTLNSAAGIQ